MSTLRAPIDPVSSERTLSYEHAVENNFQLKKSVKIDQTNKKVKFFQKSLIYLTDPPTQPISSESFSIQEDDLNSSFSINEENNMSSSAESDDKISSELLELKNSIQQYSLKLKKNDDKKTEKST